MTSTAAFASEPGVPSTSPTATAAACTPRSTATAAAVNTPSSTAAAVKRHAQAMSDRKNEKQKTSDGHGHDDDGGASPRQSAAQALGDALVESAMESAKRATADMEAQRRHDVHIFQLRQEEDRRTANASKLEFLKRQHDIAIDTVVVDCRQDVREMRARTASDVKGLPQDWANEAPWACTHENNLALDHGRC